MTKQYTNKITSELLAQFNKPSHTPEHEGQNDGD